MRTFAGGVLAAIVVIILSGFVAVKAGLVPARADGAPLPLERWAARTSLAATIRREAPKAPYPVADTPAAEQRGATLYVQNCAVCHGTAHTTSNAIALGLGVRPPQFNKRGVDDDPPGVTYWKVAHGIRFTGMPAFEGTLDQESLWDVTYFLAHKPSDIAPAARAIWERPQSVAAPTPIPERHGPVGQPNNTR